MTAEEHALIVWMFGHQAQKIDVLLKMLKSKGIIEDDDFKAYQFAVRSDAPANAALALETSTLWANLCQKAGVPFPSLPQSPPPKTE
jgi:hypothetical protein